MKSALISLALALAACSSSSGSDGGAGNLAPPLRTATRRPLWGTSVNSVLLDPFVTSDTSWGHFRGSAVHATTSTTLPMIRAFVSQSPAGVTVPVASFAAAASVDAAAESAVVLAPFPGGTPPFRAQLWISTGDAAPSSQLTAQLVPNDQPGTTYPLAAGDAPITVGGRQWSKLTLADPVVLAQGGWFVVEMDDVLSAFQLQAPELTPDATAAPQRHRPVHHDARVAVAVAVDAYARRPR